MPDPTPAAYHLFSWMRQGLLAGITTATGTGNTSTPGHLVLTVRLRTNDTHDVSPKSTGADAVVRDLFITGVRPLICNARDTSYVGTEEGIEMPMSISKWPLILRGSMLRRVTTTSGSVFIALMKEKNNG